MPQALSESGVPAPVLRLPPELQAAVCSAARDLERAIFLCQRLAAAGADTSYLCNKIEVLAPMIKELREFCDANSEPVGV